MSARAIAPDPACRCTAIVQAAEAILIEHGLEGLTIRAVLESAHVARRGFYECFAGKDDLVLAVFEATLQRAADRFAAVGEAGADPLARLRTLVVAIVSGRAEEHGTAAASDRLGAAMSREHLRLAEKRPADLARTLRPLLALIARYLADGMERGQVRRTDPERLAMLLYNLVATTAHAELIAASGSEGDLERRRALADDAWEFCRRAIQA